MCEMKKWSLGALLLVLAAAGSMALTSTNGPSSAKAPEGKPETAEIGAVYAASQRLASETDRMTVGLAQLRLNASARQPDRR